MSVDLKKEKFYDLAGLKVPESQVFNRVEITELKDGRLFVGLLNQFGAVQAVGMLECAKFQLVEMFQAANPVGVPEGPKIVT